MGRAGLKVLHCYSGNLYGGIEKTLVTLAQCGDLTPSVLREFALVFPGRLCEELRRAGAAVSVLGPARMATPWSVLNVRRRFRRLLSRSRPDLAICHSSWPHAIFAREVRRAAIPLVFWAHDVPTGSHWIERLARRTPPDMVFVNSQFTAASLHLLFKRTPYSVTRCPVVPPVKTGSGLRVPQRLRRELMTDEQSVVITIVARLEPYKGHALLLDSLARLTDVPGWTLWVIGGVQKRGEQKFLELLKQNATRTGLLERVRFVGQRDDVQELLSAADIHCQPNLRGEPFGVAFVEALHAGVPVVTTALGGALEIVDDTCGVLTRPGDPADLAEALRRLVVDSTARQRLGLQGPRRAAELCDPIRATQRIADLCSEVVNRHNGRSGPVQFL